MRRALCLLIGLLAVPAAAERVVRTEAVVAAPAAKVWEAFTTKEGVESWMVPVAEVDLRLGGTMKTNYNKEAGIGGPGTIVHHILAYEPERMFAARFDVPDTNPKLKLAEKAWWVLRLEPLGEQATRVTETMMGIGDGPEWDDVYNTFTKGNQWTMDQLKKKFAKDGGGACAGPIDSCLFVAGGPNVASFVVEGNVKASPSEVFRTYTTSEGWKAFVGVSSKIDLRIGGPFEIYFGETAPVGERGSEGCQVLAYVPGESVTYSWNAPPKLPTTRAKRTWVQVTFKDDGGGGTKIRLVHAGFGEGKDWEETRAYFEAAWPRVVGELTKYFAAKQ